MICASRTDAQVLDLKYVLQYDCDSNYYEVRIAVMEGSATTIQNRAQFNSQLTVVVPTGKVVIHHKSLLPLSNNQNYGSSTPIEWNMMNPVFAPSGMGAYDFYSWAPKLNPAAFFNDLDEGGEYVIFTFKIQNEDSYDSTIRFFDNSEDPPMSSFSGADLRNGYSLGGAANRYTGNIHRSCSTSNNINVIDKDDIKIYPNPASTRIHIESPADTQDIKLIDTTGRKIKDVKRSDNGITSVDVHDLESGLYYVQLRLDGRTHSQLLTIR